MMSSKTVALLSGPAPAVRFVALTVRARRFIPAVLVNRAALMVYDAAQLAHAQAGRGVGGRLFLGVGPALAAHARASYVASKMSGLHG